MTRQIKFRFCDGKQIYSWDWAQEFQVEHVFEPDMQTWIVMQFTGLLDKNGKEIYSGDIIKDEGGELSVVEEVPGHIIARHWRDGEAQDSDFIASVNKFEIVGNMYENKGLLKPSEGDIM